LEDSSVCVEVRLETRRNAVTLLENGAVRVRFWLDRDGKNQNERETLKESPNSF
jgi:hypothetical protein